jgi:hypothetical protein
VLTGSAVDTILQLGRQIHSERRRWAAPGFQSAKKAFVRATATTDVGFTFHSDFVSKYLDTDDHFN